MSLISSFFQQLKLIRSLIYFYHSILGSTIIAVPNPSFVFDNWHPNRQKPIYGHKWSQFRAQSPRSQRKEVRPLMPDPLSILVNLWCRRSESNRHDRKDRGILSPLRLPVSPLRHGADYYDGVPKCQEKCVDIDRKRVLDARLLSESRTCGVVAQLGERLNGIQEAASSILASSTMNSEGVKRELDPFFVPPDSHPDNGFAFRSVTRRKLFPPGENAH